MMLALSLSTLFFASLATAGTTLDFSLMVFNGQQRTSYLQQVQKFEKEYPDIKVNIKAIAAEDYKNNIEKWLQMPSYSDVMYWFAGERLNWYIRHGWIMPISKAWEKNNWRERITQAAETTVTYYNNQYALPIHYYNWGIYYKKSVFKKYQLNVPKNWQEFLKLCNKLIENGITPISLGSQEKWPVAGWFDYLDLRLNGLQFHQQLTQGNVSYEDIRVRNVFTHLQMLQQRHYFLANHSTLTMKEALPYLYRDLAAMMLMGNFWTTEIPHYMKEDFDVFPFPTINSEIDNAEEAPTDVLFIPTNAKHKEAASLFLNFMSRRDVQIALNEAQGMIAPQRHLSQKMGHLLTQGAKILANAKGLSQFYDRDNPQPIALKGMAEMTYALKHPKELSKVLSNLETLRASSFVWGTYP